MKNSESKIYWPIGLSKDMPGRTTAGPSLEPLLEEYAHSLVSPGTTVKVGWMSKTTSLLSSNFLGMVNDAYVVRDILKAQDHGYNGVMIGPHWDPGLYAAREAASLLAAAARMVAVARAEGARAEGARAEGARAEGARAEGAEAARPHPRQFLESCR